MTRLREAAARQANAEGIPKPECRNSPALLFGTFAIGYLHLFRHSKFVLVIVHSSVAFAHDKVQTAEHCGNVAHHVAWKHFRQDAQVHKGRRADLEAMWNAAALAVDVETELAFRIFCCEINFARWRVETFSHDDE